MVADSGRECNGSRPVINQAEGLLAWFADRSDDGKADWDLRSSYDPPDSGSWGGENVFDVRSKSKDTALNGEKYSDW